MAKKKSAKKIDETLKPQKELRLRSKKSAAEAAEPYIHVYHGGAVCETDTRGYPTPRNRSPLEIVVDASEGFVPLWESNVTLRWRFQEQSMLAFVDPEAAKHYIRELFGEGLLLWGDAVPVRFTEVRDAWDFEIVMHPVPNCTPNGCTLARAFFPDAGRHELELFPTMFEQPRNEQVETLAHELGHIFGLRHFFAQVAEKAFPSEVFGTHSRFSIMNYGADSMMTDNDRSDLKALYSLVWAGQITEINGTPIHLTRPFSHGRNPTQPPSPLAMNRPFSPA
jgi:hypothetical protein